MDRAVGTGENFAWKEISEKFTPPEVKSGKSMALIQVNVQGCPQIKNFESCRNIFLTNSLSIQQSDQIGFKQNFLA